MKKQLEFSEYKLIHLVIKVDKETFRLLQETPASLVKSVPGEPILDRVNKENNFNARHE